MKALYELFFFLISYVIVAVVERAQVSPGQFVSVIQVATVEQREKRVAVVVEDAEVKQELIKKRVTAVPQVVREIEDDWFILLDLPIRQPTYVPPGITDFLSPVEYSICHLFWLNCLMALLHSLCH